MFAKGRLQVTKSKKGRWIVLLDRLNNRAAMPLSYVQVNDDSYNGKDCEYLMGAGGLVTEIRIDQKTVYPPEGTKKTESAKTSKSVQRVQGKGQPDSLNFKESYLPQACFAKLELEDIDNFALKFHKVARVQEGYRGLLKFSFYRQKFKDDPGFKIRSNYGDLDFDYICKKQKRAALDLLGAELDSNALAVLNKRTAWRYIQGLGNESVYETNITLHHIYGCPYIPATIIKGVLKAYIIESYYLPQEGTIEKALEAAEGDAAFRRVFGGQEEQGYTAQRGEIIFWDAFPSETPADFEIDVMNPHYPDYYAGRAAPTDHQSPVPISFLTLPKKGVPFQFLLTGRDDMHKYKIQGKSIESLLAEALERHGLGAKTAVGYGYFI